MNKEILINNINRAIATPFYNYNTRKFEYANGDYIKLATRPDDSETYITNDEKVTDRILECLPDQYASHLVTIVHKSSKERPHAYVPLFDTDTQAKWDDALKTHEKAMMQWCREYGCD